MELVFYKMVGAGNDFILADNRDGGIPAEKAAGLARALCPRRHAVGADGLILLENDPEVDFSWRFHNSDGSEAEMCGNGARCAAKLARKLGLAGETMRFRTGAGVVEAEVLDNGRVRIGMPDPTDARFYFSLPDGDDEFRLSFVNTGVPHAVLLADDLDELPIMELAPRIRHHEAFQPAGTNVNFVRFHRGGEVSIRTFERGVEGETLGCGTGVVAAAVVRAATDATPSPIRVATRSGEVLTVHYKKKGLSFKEIFLEGEARLVYQARLSPEILD